VFSDVPSSSVIMVNGSDDSDKMLSSESDEDEIWKESPPRDSPDKCIHVSKNCLVYRFLLIVRILYWCLWVIIIGTWSVDVT
jgi:hypothetical protein